jgi:hypothetical protein
LALNADSTVQDALAQYNNNLDWDGNPAKAQLALAAIRWLLVNRPMVMETAGGNKFDFSALDEQCRRLEQFVRVTQTRRATFVRGKMLT